MATQHNFRIKNGLEVGGVLIVNSSGQLQAASISGAITATSLQLGSDAQPTLTGDGTQLKIQTTGGYVAIGPDNSSWMHFSTDRNSFYFNKKITVNEGIVDSYDEDLQLRRAASTTARLRITAGTTISDQALTAPSVGVTNIVTNKVVKFDGTVLNDSNITDTGSLITLGSNTTVNGSITLSSNSTSVNTRSVLARDTNGLNIGTTNATTAISIDNSANVTMGYNLTVTGNLIVNGTTVTLNTATLDVEDKNITLNYGAGDTSGSANGAGITIQDAVNSTTNATILWDKANSRFTTSHALNVGGTLTAGSVNATGDITINSTTDDKLRLYVNSSDGNDWNYISYYGRDGTRDSYIGTDNDGDLNLYSDKNGNLIQLGASGINFSGKPLRMTGTEFLDTSRNLTVGTIDSGAITATAGLFDNGTSTLLNVRCDDGGNAIVRAGGQGQGTGAFEVSQDDGSHGGGMSYNGDGSPAFAAGETSDHVTFYRIAAGTRTEVFHYAYNADAVTFNGNISVAGTVDGVDIAARNGVLTTTTNTANAALPKAGGTMTGNLTVGGTTQVTASEFRITSSAAYHTHLNYLNGGNNIISQANGGSTAIRNSSGHLFTFGSTGNLNVHSGNFQMGGTTVIDASRNLTNIATIENTGKVSSSIGSSATYSRPLLEITSSSTPTQIKITTNIPYSGGSTHAHSVTIRGFNYGSASTADLQISWHVYNSSFYNRAVTSSGSWSPVITLAVESNKVVIHLAGPGYWPKMYVESMYNAYGGESQAGSWSWSDAAISADASTPNQTVPYKSAFGNGITMSSSGLTVPSTISGGTLKANASGTATNAKLHVGAVNSPSSGAIAQFGGFLRAANYYILHESPASANSAFFAYTSNDADFTQGEGSYTGAIRASGYRVGTTMVIDSSRNISAGTISSGAITVGGIVTNAAVNTFQDSAGAVINFKKGTTSHAVIANRSYGFHNGNGLSIATMDVQPIRFAINDVEKLQITSTGNISINSGSLLMGGTTVIDASRNLTNIGTISSGAITATGDLTVYKTGADSVINLEGNSSYDPVVNWGSDQQSSIAGEGFQIWYDNSVGDVHLHTTYANDVAAIRFHTRTGTDKATNNERFTINGNGNVGIGDTNPDNKLVVKDGNIKLKSNADGNTGILMLYDAAGAQSGQVYPSAGDLRIWSPNDVLILPTGKVGIGTSSPAQKLHVSAGSTNANTIARLQQGTTAGNYSAIEVGRTDGAGTAHITPAVTGGVPISGTAGILLGSTNGSIPAVGIQTPNSSNGHIVFNPKGSEKVRITADGNVGIGIQSPFSRLQSGGHTFSGGNGMYANGRVGISNHGELTGLMLASTYNDSAHPEYGLVFVQGPSTSSYNVWSISPDGPAKGDSLNFHYQAQSTNIHSPSNAKVTFDGNGNVGIGETSPGQKLQVNGNIRADGHYYVGGSIVIDSSRNLTNIGTISSGDITCGNIASGVVTINTTSGTPLNVDSSATAIVVPIGAVAQTSYTDVQWITDGGNGEIFKGGANYTSWGGTRAFNIYNSNGVIAFHPSGTANVLQITSTVVNSTKPIQISGTTVIDSSRNLTNIGTISSGNISAPKLYISNGTTYGVGIVNASSARFDTVDSGHSTDPLELCYHNGNGVRIGPNGGDLYLSAGSIQITGTTVIDSSRNLTGASFTDGYITWSAAQLNRYGSNIELQYTPTNASTTVKIGANGSNPTIFNAYTGAATFAGTISSGAITAPSIRASSGAFYIHRSSDGTQAIRVDADGVVIIPTNYFYVSASQGSYFSSAVRFRGTISNDTGTNVTFGQPINVTGAIKVGSTEVIDASRNLNNVVTATVNSLHVKGNLDTGYSTPGSMTGGLSLWGAGATTSQMMFKPIGSGSLGNHGFCTDSYNTYFVMDTTNRGWVFRNASTATNVASISNTGGIAGVTVRASNAFQIGTTTVIDANRQIFAKDATFDNGTSTTVSVKCDDGGTALIRANGDSQGTGAIEVGQSNDYGGGMSYNGDGSPGWAAGETADHITFYRLDNGTRTEVFHYPYSANDVSFNGSITAAGNVTAYSDIRLKDDLQPIEDAVSKVQKLKGVTYFRNDNDDENRQAGLIAQDVELVLPEAVRETEDGIKTVNYNATIALLVESIKEQQTLINRLEKRINTLENNGE